MGLLPDPFYVLAALPCRGKFRPKARATVPARARQYVSDGGVFDQLGGTTIKSENDARRESGTATRLSGPRGS